ncbi:hypothetical protein NPIL_187121 [Nephila pilipes]|uniref:Uncharacterized protein n=1 Tax=Nephila pilipes TaxID=299642 RepID=A0A8X6TXG2_NEPPI|nr:hypothetical protein NPIL_187121 [Nephila pilipes]
MKAQWPMRRQLALYLQKRRCSWEEETRLPYPHGTNGTQNRTDLNYAIISKKDIEVHENDRRNMEVFPPMTRGSSGPGHCSGAFGRDCLGFGESSQKKAGFMKLKESKDIDKNLYHYVLFTY